MVSILTVAENYWGEDFEKEIGSADHARMRRFADEVNRFYDSRPSFSDGEAESRIYPGGWCAANPSVGQLRLSLLNELLYADSVLIPDLTAIWFYPDPDRLPALPETVFPDGTRVNQSETEMWKLFGLENVSRNFGALKDRLKTWLLRLREFGPLIDAGLVIPVSQPHAVAAAAEDLSQATMECVRDSHFIAACTVEHDEPFPIWDSMRGFQMVPIVELPGVTEAALKARAQHAAYHTLKNIVVARSGGASYVPSNDTDAWLVKNLPVFAGDNAHTSARSHRVPAIRNLTPKVLLEIRRYDEDFEQFRMDLRRTIKAASTIGMNAQEEVDAWMAEEIRCASDRIRASSVIRKYVEREGVLGLTMDIAVILGLASSWKTGTATATGRLLVSFLKQIHGSRVGTNKVFATLAKIKLSEPSIGAVAFPDCPTVIRAGSLKLPNGLTIRIGNPNFQNDTITWKDSGY